MPELQIKRGGTVQVDAEILKEGEIIIDLTNQVMYAGTGGALASDRFPIGGGGLIEYAVTVDDADVGLDEIHTDVNANDYTGDPHADPASSGNLWIASDHVVSFGNNTTQIWRYAGPKDVSIGPDTGAVDHHVTIAGDFILLTTGQVYDDVYYRATWNDMILIPSAKQGDVCITQDDSWVYKLSTQDPTVLSNWEVIGRQIAAEADTTYTGVLNETAMLALATAKQGDVVANRVDTDTTYKLAGADPTVLANWVAIARNRAVIYDFYTEAAMLADGTIKYPGDIMRINSDSAASGDDSLTYHYAGPDKAVIGSYFEIARYDFGSI